MNDKYLWDLLCLRLWSDKIYVPDSVRILHQNGQSKLAYQCSLKDSKRQYISKEELCSFEWNFRFKASAGEHWTHDDSWWNKQGATILKFNLDGTMSAVGDWYPQKVHDPSMKNRHWRFIDSAAGRTGPNGSFVQVNSYPPYMVSRYRNWGFIMQSCWTLFTSFQMPLKGVCLDLEDESLDITTEVMQKEAMEYNLSVHFLQHLNQAQALNLLHILAQVHDQDDNEEQEDEDDEDQN